MTTILIVPDAGCTYEFFRRQLLCLLARAQERGHDEPSSEPHSMRPSGAGAHRVIQAIGSSRPARMC